MVDRRQALQLSIWLRDRMGDQRRQARPNAEESIVFGHHHGILEFAGCDLLSGGVDSVGNSKLRERPAAASDGNRPRGGAVSVSGDQGRIGVQERVTYVTEIYTPNRLAFST